MQRRGLVIHVNTGDAPRQPEIAVVIIVDNSGSMFGENLTAVRAEVTEFVRYLPEQSMIGLIGFGSKVEVAIPPTIHREFVRDRLAEFEGQAGSTNLYDAIAEGFRSFGDLDRHRYLVVLTDGGDTGSSRTPNEVADDAIRHGVRIITVGVGKVDETSLQKIAARTGGRYFHISETTGLQKVFLDALTTILSDSEKLRLRPELERLLGESSQAPELDAGWTLHLSLDQWESSEIWEDDSHLRFPEPAIPTVAGHSTGFATWRATFRTSLARRLRAQSAALTDLRVDPHLDVLVAGWLHDPAYRALSPRVVETLLEVRDELRHIVTGNLNILLLPLTHALGERLPKVADQASCFAWLGSTVNRAASNCSIAVLPIGERNQDAEANPDGFAGLGEDAIIGAAANVIRCLRLAPSVVYDTATWNDTHGQRAIHAGGTASIGFSKHSAIRRDAARRMRVAIERILEPRAEPALPMTTATTFMAAERFSFSNLHEQLLAPLDQNDPWTGLVSVRLDRTNFWPVPRDGDTAEFLSRLPAMLSNKASEYLYLKQEALLRIVERRLARRRHEILAKIESRVDGLLRARESGGLDNARAFLQELVGLLREQEREIGDLDPASVDWRGLRLFEVDSTRSGHLSRSVAHEKFEAALRRRPEARSLAVRVGGMALAAGLVARKFFENGSLSAAGGAFDASVVAVLMALFVGFLGAVYWFHAWQRIRLTLYALLDAIESDARAVAAASYLRTLARFYGVVRGWIGDVDKVKLWDGRRPLAESDYSERERLAHLEERLRDLLHMSTLRETAESPFANPFVLEIGARRDPLNPRSFRIDAARWDTDSGREALPVPVTGWRVICRRVRSETLEEFVENNKDRLAFVEKWWEAEEAGAAAEFEERHRISRHLGGIESRDFAALLRVLEKQAYPAVPLRDSAKPITAGDYWLSSAGEFGKLSESMTRANQSSELAAAKVIGIEATWHCSLLRMSRVELKECTDWWFFHRAWASLSVPNRKSVLDEWHNSGGWIDYTTGAPLLAEEEDRRPDVQMEDSSEL
ncbi:MAG: VWA domain-containing protein [Gemmatimonadota bacterium]|nr:VWA domain-containing protein [Gemmatimonadota bacterium]